MTLALFFVLILTALSGCAARVYSPPAGTFLLESPGTVGAGKQAVAGDLFRGGELFGPKLTSGRVTYRRGVSDELELSIAPSVTWILGSHRGDSHPGIYAARAGLKYGFVRHFAMVLGGGVGGSAAGAFLSPDIGFVTGYENPYLVPFLSGKSLMSVPIAPRKVHFTVGDDSGDDTEDEDGSPDRYSLRPRTTFGLQTALGLRLPLTWDERAEVKPSILCALGWNVLRDTTAQKSHNYGGAACAVEAIF